jgi:hypothetical protein
MAKELTEQDKKNIKDSVIASCISKGIKPTVQTSSGAVPNPQYASCVELGYQDALKEASKGKLGLWFNKVNSFVQSQGGVTGMFQSVSSIANQYKNSTADMSSGMSNTQFPVGYGEDQQAVKQKTDNMGLWLVMIILLVVLIIASVIYFRNKSKAV